MTTKKAVVATLVSLAIAATLSSLSAIAAPGDNGKLFGRDAPLSMDALPPGRMKERLEALPSAAQQRALEWLQRFNIPEQDYDFLRFDDEGGVLYVDPRPVEDGSSNEAELPVAEGLTVSEAFTLHSKPGSMNKVVVDFDGHLIKNTAWNSSANPEYYARPYDTDGSPSTFSDAELQKIHEIWVRIAEDFAPFDIDVTTEDPGQDGPTSGRILITKDVDENNVDMPYKGSGGVAYVGVWGESNYGSYYSPAIVYYNNLGGGNPIYVSEAASHELGHNLGLGHDGTGSQSYYGGHGSGFISWGPIMGTGYNRQVSQWNNGDYANANNFQDDLAIIDGRLGYRMDDHGETTSSATPLYVDADGYIDATNPETENWTTPSLANKGIIETNSDVDTFLLEVGYGEVYLEVTPAWAAFARSSARGANLDVEATLIDASGNVIYTVDPLDNTNAIISTTLDTGAYYLSITGVGNSVSPYSAYGGIGQYFITGRVTPMAPPTEPPAAPGYLFAQAPSHTQVALDWVDNADNESGFYVERQQGGGGWSTVATLARNATMYSDSGLESSTTYNYRVRAFNIIGDAVSNEVTVTTLEQPMPPAAPGNVSASDNGDGSATITWSDNSYNELQFEIQRESAHPKNGRWRDLQQVGVVGADTVTLNDASGSGTFRYRVRAVNEIGASAWSPWGTVTVGDSSDSGDGGGGGGKKCHPKRGC